MPENFNDCFEFWMQRNLFSCKHFLASRRLYISLNHQKNHSVITKFHRFTSAMFSHLIHPRRRSFLFSFQCFSAQLFNIYLFCAFFTQHLLM
jgi:hypothetical protein